MQDQTTFSIRDNSILYCTFNQGPGTCFLNVRTARRYLDKVISLSNGSPMPLLIDLRSARGTFSTEAAKLLASKSSQGHIAICEAYVVNTLAIELLVRAFKRIYPNDIPFAIFKDVPSAEKFIRSHTLAI
ncbi:hypothetical protein [Robiginitalea sp. SC105]|uniref:DUF7793 family protein n=1 Tax=Robiginitalea sp. SC105 TaxID=2762332 RepID=UPI00163A2500|nr:hypothetical protein [Robiginitalea sp. SC105]MBC2840406.1 hypothetical protein [Robiginitalea sp. SC105]